MANGMMFECTGLLVGKCFEKKYEGFEKDGKKGQGAHDDRYAVSVVVGTLRKNGVLFDDKPSIATGFVSPQTYIRLKDFEKVNCKVAQKIGRETTRYLLLEVEGWTVVDGGDKTDDEYDEEAAILAKIESGELKPENTESKKTPAKKEKEV